MYSSLWHHFSVIFAWRSAEWSFLFPLEKGRVDGWVFNVRLYRRMEEKSVLDSYPKLDVRVHLCYTHVREYLLTQAHKHILRHLLNLVEICMYIHIAVLYTHSCRHLTRTWSVYIFCICISHHFYKAIQQCIKCMHYTQLILLHRHYSYKIFYVYVEIIISYTHLLFNIIHLCIYLHLFYPPTKNKQL